MAMTYIVISYVAMTYIVKKKIFMYNCAEYHLC
jgi:hypothetical protein